MAYYIQPISASTSTHVSTLPVSALAPVPALLCTCCGSRSCSVACYRTHYIQFNCHVWWCPNRPAVPGLSVPNAGSSSVGAVTPLPIPALIPNPGPPGSSTTGIRPSGDHGEYEQTQPANQQATNTVPTPTTNRSSNNPSTEPNHQHQNGGQPVRGTNNSQEDWDTNWRRGFELGVGIGTGMGLMIMMSMAGALPDHNPRAGPADFIRQMDERRRGSREEDINVHGPGFRYVYHDEDEPDNRRGRSYNSPVRRDGHEFGPERTGIPSRPAPRRTPPAASPSRWGDRERTWSSRSAPRSPPRRGT